MIKLKRLYTDTHSGQKWAIGWQTPDGRFTIEERKFHGDKIWWLLKDTKSVRKLRDIECEHDTLRDAREMIELLLEEENPF
jgi:hypothetical protein